MADENQAVESPEETILGAVLGPDTQDLEADRDAKAEADIEAPNEVDPRGDEHKQAKAEEAPPDEDEIEIPGEEGQEPTRLKVADLVRSHREYEAFKGQRAEIIERVTHEVTQRSQEQFQAVQRYSQEAAYAIQAAVQLLRPPQPPNPDLLNRMSQNYDPDSYHMQFAQYQQASQQFQQAQGLGQQLLQQAQAAQNYAQEQREAVELEKLLVQWPEFRQPETINQFVNDMGKLYGFSAEELDAVLVDHRQVQVARDAMAFRQMKAKSVETKQKVEAKPKLVRSKQQAKGTSAQARDQRGRYSSEALETLKKTNSDDAAAAFFAGLLREGRI